jgi:hypothetical protein
MRAMRGCDELAYCAAKRRASFPPALWFAKKLKDYNEETEMRLVRRDSVRVVALAIAALFALGAWLNRASAAFIDLTPTNGINSSTSVSLGSLVSSATNGVTVGDKVFSDFDYTPTGDMPAAADVTVLGFKDPDGNWGISFHAAFTDFPGGAASSTAQIDYQVAVDAANSQLGRKITDAHLFMGGVGMDVNSSAEVNENVAEQTGFLLHGFQISSSSGQTTQQLSDAKSLATPQSLLHVTKHITLTAGEGSILPARLTVVDQSFSQTPVPEPSTLCMALAGFIGCSVARRWRRS